MIRAMRRYIARRRIDKIMRALGVPDGYERIFSGSVHVEATVFDDARRFAEFFVDGWKDPA